MAEQSLEQDILDEAGYAQKYGDGMASLDFALLDEWAERAAELEKKLAVKDRMLELICQAFEIFAGQEWTLDPDILKRVEKQAREETDNEPSDEHKEGE